MKLQIMKVKPEPSDEEIEGYMDFDGLIKKHQSSTSFTTTKWIALAVATLGVITASYFLIMRTTTSAPSSPSLATKSTIPAEVKPEVTAPLSDSLQKENHAKERGSHSEQTGTKTSQEKTKVTTAKKEEPAKDVFEEAEPVEGFAHLYNYFNQQLKYPDAHLKDKIEGVEIVSFVIDENGKPIDLKVVQSLGAAFDDEAIRLIRTMPKWKPAQLNHHPVASKLSLPFTFSLSK